MDEELKELVAEVFNIKEKNVTPELSQDNLDNWDSMNHLKLITAVEEELDINLTMDEIEEITSIAKLISIIEGHKS